MRSSSAIDSKNSRKNASSYAAHVMPVKLYAGMIFDLLWDGAKLARRVIDEYEPQVEKAGYLDYWRDILEG